MTSPEDLREVLSFIRGRQLLADPADLYDRLITLEERMAEYDAQLAALTANVDNIRADVQWLHGELVRLQTEAAGRDSAFAAALQPLVDKTAQIAAATPEPTVPAPAEPTQPPA